MNPVDRLTELFEHFPGIGPRQARRFVQYLLGTTPSTRGDLAETIKHLGSETKQCKQCFRWFVKPTARGGVPSKAVNAGKNDVCEICGGTSRERSLLFIVEKDADIENVERSGFKGLYFVLGGTIPLAADEPQKHIRVRELVKRIESDATEKKLKEIILGLSATTEGDHTRLILQEKILPMAQGFDIKLSSLGRGLSTGSELEYADPDTIASALNSRN